MGPKQPAGRPAGFSRLSIAAYHSGSRGYWTPRTSVAEESAPEGSHAKEIDPLAIT